MNRIKQLREELKISQNDLAKKLNKTQQMISLYENGTYEPDLDGYIILSKLFNCSVEYIAGKSDIRTPEKISLDEMDIAFASGIKGLNKENQQTLKSIMDGLLAKQKIEEENKDK